MIVSASRRTDIPALYPRWLRNRLREGFARVPHPFRPDRVRTVDLRPPPEGDMEALVLWTRDPGPLLPDVEAWERSGLRTLWLVTITGYPRDLEPSAPPPERALAALERMARVVGPERIAWRYDPLIRVPALGMDDGWIIDRFGRLARRVAPLAGRCILSLYDPYAAPRRRLAAAGLSPDTDAPWEPLTRDLARVARELGLAVQSCCDDLTRAGIPRGGCISGELLDRLWGLGLAGRRDPGQRPGCLCAPSVDIGVYNTCTHGCLYCYATRSPGRARGLAAAHDPQGETLA